MTNLSISRCTLRWTLVTTVALVSALGFTPAAALAQTYTVLHEMNPKKNDPYNFMSARMAQGRDGNFYMESEGGGAACCGTISKFTPAGKVTVLYNLTGPEGQFGIGGLTLGPDGNFYGNADEGGTNNFGTLFKATPSGTLTVLHNFANTGDGMDPVFALVLGGDGDFYGTSGSSTGGVVYKITPSGEFSTIYSLTGGGSFDGQLNLGNDGNLYGGTDKDGVNGAGTDFKLAPSGAYTTLHSFTSSEGSNPLTGIIQGTGSEFYGTLIFGANNGPGTIYPLTSSKVFNVFLHMTIGDGELPIGLLLASDGNLYGAAEYGGPDGAAGCGTIFQITPAGVFTVLHSLDQTDGCHPEAQLFQGTNGLLYGTTINGTVYDEGVFFSLDVSLPPFAGQVSPSGHQGGTLGILGQGFNSGSVVTFGGGVQATSITLQGSTYISAVIPSGAVTGDVSVTTGSTTLTSIQPFTITL
jgi:uncharacterized repeat protein (TIGR03803 family)